MPNAHLPAFLSALLAALLGSAGAAALRRRLRAPPFDLRGMLTILAVAAGLPAACAGAPTSDPVSIWFALAWACLVMIAGVLVDAKRIPGVVRTGLILVAGVALANQGVQIETFKVPFTTRFVDLGPVAPLISAAWLLLFSSLFGRAATVPGVPVGVGAAAAVTLYAICRLRPDLTADQGALLAALLAGACLPQLPFAARIAQGGATSGGYVIGFLVGVVSIVGALKNTAFLVAAVPLIVVGAPLFAVAYTYAADLRSGWRAIAVAEQRKHLHQVLLEQGYSPRQVQLIVLAGTVYLCALALLLVAIIEVAFVLKLVLLGAAIIAGLVFFYVILRMMRRPAGAPGEGGPRAVSILGVKLHAVTMTQALAEAAGYIRKNKPHMIVTTDATGLMRAHDDAEFRRIVNDADLVTPDGAGVVLSARLLNIPIEARCAGCDMVSGLCEVASQLGRSVYLLGAQPGVAEMAAERLKSRIPDLDIAGCRDGYFSEEDEPGVVAQIKQAGPAVLFVALGIPRQEKWIRDHLAELGVPVCVGVGGSFDVISGLKERAPVWMQRAGLEWLYRVAKEPWRLPRLTALPRIVILSFAELLRPPRSR